MQDDPKHPPQDPETEKLPVEPEMDKSRDPEESGRNPRTEPAKKKRVDDL